MPDQYQFQNPVTELGLSEADADLITKEYILKSLKKIADRCMQDEQVVDSKGEPTGEYKFDSRGANKSLELLGKNLNLWKDQPIGFENVQLADMYKLLQVSGQQYRELAANKHNDPPEVLRNITPLEVKVSYPLKSTTIQSDC